MAGFVVGCKFCNSHQMHLGLTEKCFEDRHNSYASPLPLTMKLIS